MIRDSQADLKQRKQLRLRLRPNLEFISQEEAGQTFHVLRDPVSLRYFRLEKRQKFVVDLLDGVHTLEEIQQAFEKAHPPQRLPLEMLEAFAAQLVSSGLVLADGPRAGPILYEQMQKQRQAALNNRLANFLAIKIPLFNPDRLLEKLLPIFGWLFTRTTAQISLGLMVLAVGLVVLNWGEFQLRLAKHHQMFTPAMLLQLWLTFGLVKILHELGHGLCCKKQGGTVPEMGLYLLFFFPALYCNVSESWRLPNRWQRIAISAAGIYVEMLLAFSAVLLWWLSDPASPLHQIAFCLVLVCSVNTLLLNGNPLLRYDGYYIFADWIGQPNLADTSGRVLRSQFARWIGLPMAVPGWVPSSKQRFLFLYGLASLIYRWLILTTSLYALYLFLEKSKLEVLSLLLAGLILTLALGWGIFGLVRLLSSPGAMSRLRLSRLALMLLLLTALISFVFLAPLPHAITGTALVQTDPDQMERVIVPECGGFLQQLLAVNGQQVEQGQVLAILTNPQLEISLRLVSADQTLRQDHQRALASYISETRRGDRAAGEWKQTEYELDGLRQHQEQLQRQREHLMVRAPRSGRVTGLPEVDHLGRWYEPGEGLCRVESSQQLRVVFLVKPADQAQVPPQGRAELRLHGSAGRTWSGRVSDVALVDARSIPPQLSSQAGGEVAAQADAVSRLMQPHSPHYLVTIHLDRPDALLQPGMLGRVRLAAESETLARRARRYLAETFHWGL